jgi:hypothetical protein
MATFIHSKLSVVKLDTAGGVLTDISQYTNSVSFPMGIAEVPTTCFGATAHTYIAGFSESTVSMSGNWDRTFDAMMSAIYAAFQAGTLASVSFEYHPEGTDTGDRKYTCELVMTSWEPGSEIEDPVTWSAEFRVSGTITPGAN